MDKLKPCPFCGGKAKLNTNSSRITSFAYCYCRKCLASGHFAYDEKGNGKYIFEAIEAWNRRVENG